MRTLTTRSLPGRVLLLLGAVLLTVIGCGTSPPSRFYVLTPLAAAEAGAPAAGAVGVRIGKIELPEYLSVKEIVTRSSPSRLERAAFDLWGEPLDNGFARVLRRDLALMLPAASVVTGPLVTGGKVDHHLFVAVDRFDVDSTGVARLEARYGLSGPDYEAEIETHDVSFERPVAGDGYEAIVAALSETIADLAREIAGRIR